MKRVKIAVALAGILFTVGISQAFATLQLRLTDGGTNVVVIADQGPGDSNPTVGRILFFGPVGNWDVSVVGLIIGPNNQPFMDAGTILVSPDSNARLTIELSEINFTATGAARIDIGGITDGSVTYRVWRDVANTNFGHGNVMASLGPFSEPSFSGTAIGPTGAIVPYSVTMEMIIENPVADGSSSFDAQFEVTCDGCVVAISCPAPVTVQCGGDTSTNATGMPTITADPACNTVVTTNDVITPGNCPAPYTISRTWTVTPPCGAARSCTQIITVRDTTPPTISCSSNKTVECAQAWSFDVPTATDNCGDPTIEIVSTITNVTACGSTITRTWSASDPCGNSVQCSQQVTINCGTSCVPGTFTFSGSTDDKGKPNTRAFTANGVKVNVTAFSRIKNTDNWSPAYVGVFSKGLGVTDSGEDGDDPTHTVDNVDRDNFLLFEFSQPVIVDRAYLGFVESDSDMTIWVGNAADPFNNHLSLNNALLTSLQFTEENTGGNSPRWADLNSGQIVGNIFVLAARIADTRDQFKLNKLEFCKPDCGSPPPPVCTAATVTFSGSSEESGPLDNKRMFVASNGVIVKVTGFSRTKDTGVWNQGYVGLYSKGLGVTDGSEGNGGGDSHTTDNTGRDNFLLFEFSEPIVVNRAYLGYVVSDSDVNAWIGNVSNLFNTTLSDAVLNGFGWSETNTTDSSSTRWADLNSAEVTANALVISARLNDSGDRFKLNKLDICRPGAVQGSPKLPSPWATKDIGPVGASGGANYSSGKFTVSGSGDYIWGTEDEFRYFYQSADGNCSIVARVVSVQNTHPWAKAGVMIRESLSAGAKHASMFIFPGNGVQWQTRTSSGASSSDVITSGFAPPYWLKVVRSGSTLTGYASLNGSMWTLMGSRSISMSSTVYIGLGVTSHDDGTLCTAVFDNVTASP